MSDWIDNAANEILVLADDVPFADAYSEEIREIIRRHAPADSAVTLSDFLVSAKRFAEVLQDPHRSMEMRRALQTRFLDDYSSLIGKEAGDGKL